VTVAVAAHVTPVVAALRWDPQLRGALILMTGLLLLPGSIYLLLATNMGARIGFLLAFAGITGWIFVLASYWTIYGTGDKGATAEWKATEVVTGEIAGHATTPGTAQFPVGWRVLLPGTPALAEAQAAADKALVPSPPSAKSGSAATPAFPPVFKSTTDYVMVGGYTRGGHNYILNLFGWHWVFSIRHHKFYLHHQPHYFILRVQKALTPVTLAGGAPTLPAADPTQPLVSVVMKRDVGSKRLPSAMIALGAFLLFALTCERLHAHDKASLARRAAEGGGRGPPTGRGGPGGPPPGEDAEEEPEDQPALPAPA